jgi:hypothetical protein
LLILLPILVVLLAWAGSHLAGPFSRMNFTVRLADKVKEAQAGGAGRSKGAAAPSRSEKPAPEGGKDADPTSDELLAFGKTNKSPGELFARAAQIHARFQTGGWWFGAFVGLTIGLKLIALSVRRRRLEYEADRAGCVACARCFEYCPGEKGLDNPEATAKALIP